MTFRCGSGSCYFRHWPSRLQQKTNFFEKVFLLITLLFKGAFISFFKDKKSKRSHKTAGIKVVLTLFAWWWKDPELVDPKPDPGGLITRGSGGSGFGSGTLLVCAGLWCRPRTPVRSAPHARWRAARAACSSAWRTSSLPAASQLMYSQRPSTP